MIVSNCRFVLCFFFSFCMFFFLIFYFSARCLDPPVALFSLSAFLIRDRSEPGPCGAPRGELKAPPWLWGQLGG